MAGHLAGRLWVVLVLACLALCFLPRLVTLSSFPRRSIIVCPWRTRAGKTLVRALPWWGLIFVLSRGVSHTAPRVLTAKVPPAGGGAIATAFCFVLSRGVSYCLAGANSNSTPSAGEATATAVASVFLDWRRSPRTVDMPTVVIYSRTIMLHHACPCRCFSAGRSGVAPLQFECALLFFSAASVLSKATFTQRVPSFPSVPDRKNEQSMNFFLLWRAYFGAVCKTPQIILEGCGGGGRDAGAGAGMRDALTLVACLKSFDHGSFSGSPPPQLSFTEIPGFETSCRPYLPKYGVALKLCHPDVIVCNVLCKTRKQVKGLRFHRILPRVEQPRETLVKDNRWFWGEGHRGIRVTKAFSRWGTVLFYSYRDMRGRGGGGGTHFVHGR